MVGYKKIHCSFSNPHPQQQQQQQQQHPTDFLHYIKHSNFLHQQLPTFFQSSSSATSNLHPTLINSNFQLSSNFFHHVHHEVRNLHQSSPSSCGFCSGTSQPLRWGARCVEDRCRHQFGAWFNNIHRAHHPRRQKSQHQWNRRGQSYTFNLIPVPGTRCMS